MGLIQAVMLYERESVSEAVGLGEFICQPRFYQRVIRYNMTRHIGTAGTWPVCFTYDTTYVAETKNAFVTDLKRKSQLTGSSKPAL